MKKLLFTSIWISLVLLASAHTTVLEKATRIFSKEYKGAVNAEWQPLKEGGYVCKFTLGGIAKKAFYDKSGNWLSTVAGYTEGQMPRDVRRIVLSNYYDYSILYVHEVNMPRRPAVYMVQVKYGNLIKILRVVEGEIEEVRELEVTE